MALLLKASGAIVDLLPGNRRAFTLPELQTAVGGDIELVRAPHDVTDVDGRGMWLVLNEDGKRLQLAINAFATVLLHRAGGRPDDVVVGDVILGTHAELGGEEEGDASRSIAAPWVVWSFEHDAWWGPNRWGYTRQLAEAGRYTQAEADEIVTRANFVALNEIAMLLSDAQSDNPPRYCVVAEHNHHGGAGWAIFDRARERTDGGWFADRRAAEQTAGVLNRTGGPHDHTPP